LPTATQRLDAQAVELRDRRIERSQQERMRQPHGLKARTAYAGVQRFNVDADIR